MDRALPVGLLQSPVASKNALGRVLEWIGAAVGPLFVIEPKLIALFFLLSIVDMATAGFFAEGKVIRERRGKAALGAVYRFLQNLIASVVLVWISNAFAFFAFLAPWVVAYVSLRIARNIINAITPAESDLRALWERFWKLFYDRNAHVIEDTAGASMTNVFRERQGLPLSPVDPYVLPSPGSTDGGVDVGSASGGSTDPYDLPG